MNTANLQMEGLCLAIAMINRTLVQKGVLSEKEVRSALKEAEALVAGDRIDGISSANRDAVSFPIRLLQHANNSTSTGTMLNFSELAKGVGEAHRSETSSDH